MGDGGYDEAIFRDIIQYKIFGLFGLGQLVSRESGEEDLGARELL